MSKKHRSVSTARIERWQADEARRQRRDQIMAVITIVILVGIILLAVGIQISHHM
jgi:cell division protein FtsB